MTGIIQNGGIRRNYPEAGILTMLQRVGFQSRRPLGKRKTAGLPARFLSLIFWLIGGITAGFGGIGGIAGKMCFYGVSGGPSIMGPKG